MQRIYLILVWGLLSLSSWQEDLFVPGQHVVLHEVRLADGGAVVGGKVSDGMGTRQGFLARVTSSGLSWQRLYPELSSIRWIFPDPQSLQLWGQSDQNPALLIRMRVDTGGTPLNVDTFSVVGHFPSVMAGNGDTLWMASLLDSVLAIQRWVQDIFLDSSTLVLPGFSYGGDLRTILPLDGILLIGGTRNVPSDPSDHTDGFLLALDTSLTLLWSDSLVSPQGDGVWGIAPLASGEICVVGMHGGDGWLGRYTLAGVRLGEAQIGMPPPDPFSPAEEWAMSCFNEEGGYVFPGWKSLYGFPSAGPWVAMVRANGRVDTLPAFPEWTQFTKGLAPVRLGPWEYLFVGDVHTTPEGVGVGRLFYIEDDDPPRLSLPPPIPFKAIKL